VNDNAASKAAPGAPPSRVRAWVGSLVLLGALAGTAFALVSWKRDARRADEAAAAAMPEPAEVVTLATARAITHGRTMTAIGTVRALQSVTLRNELEGTVRETHLAPGKEVAEGTLLVALDVAVEQAEIRALEAQATLAEKNLERLRRANEKGAAPSSDVDRAVSERDVIRAQIDRIRAIVERKTLRAPFRARVGLVDLAVGQFLDAGTVLTTLQGLDPSVHVDFPLPQRAAAVLAPGTPVEVIADGDANPRRASVVAVDARVEAATRSAWIRALLEGAAGGPAPGSAVRVRVPIGAPRSVVTVPVSALRRGPEGDHVFLVSEDAQGALRARPRKVSSGEFLGDEVLILEGLSVGDRVAASGSFKLRDGVLVVPAAPPSAEAGKR
jgi:membrane fusion protein (multidrug efflux system)